MRKEQPHLNPDPAGTRASRTFQDQALDTLSSADKKLCVTVPEAAGLLSVSTATMWRAVYERQLRACKVRGRVLIRMTDLEKFLEDNLLEDFNDV